MDINPERKRDWGRRLEVFWEGDGVFYRGTVTGYSTTSGKHTIMYDDGDTERVKLDQVGRGFEVVWLLKGLGGGLWRVGCLCNACFAIVNSARGRLCCKTAWFALSLSQHCSMKQLHLASAGILVSPGIDCIIRCCTLNAGWM
jgi:hypothetical protein